MDIGIVSVRYARALLKSSIDAKIENKVYHEMITLAKSYIEVPDLKKTIDNPMLANDKKQELIEPACGGNVSPLTHRFVTLVLKELRVNFLQFMANSYISLYRQQQNITRGKLITAVAVNSATEQKMKQLVESKTRGTVEFVSVEYSDVHRDLISVPTPYSTDLSWS